MKALLSFTFFAIIVMCVVGCKDDDIQPIKPTPQNTNNEKGILYGVTSLWRLVGGSDALVWDEKQAGVKVEIMGTNNSVETDGYGLYKLSGIDSGFHSLRFSKIGYDTVTIDSIFCNGKDSTKVLHVFTDLFGKKSVPAEIIDLRELTPSVSVQRASAFAVEIITIDTIKDHLEIREIRRDTSYTFNGEFSISLQSAVQATQDSLDAGFYVAISGNSVVDESLKPTEFSDSQANINKGWAGYWGSSFATKPKYNSTRDFRISSLGKNSDRTVTLGRFTKLMNYKVSRTQQLYLHIIPVTKELSYKQESNRLSTWKRAIVGYKLGDLVTVPIEWK